MTSPDELQKLFLRRASGLSMSNTGRTAQAVAPPLPSPLKKRRLSEDDGLPGLSEE